MVAKYIREKCAQNLGLWIFGGWRVTQAAPPAALSQIVPRTEPQIDVTFSSLLGDYIGRMTLK